MKKNDNLTYDELRPRTHGGWLRLRNQGFGSSEACAICGLPSYGTTRITIWRRKTGLDGLDEKDNKVLRAGHQFEPVIPALFEQETGAIFDRRSKGDWIARSKAVPWMQASVDRLYWTAGTPADQRTAQNSRIFECKTTMKKVDKDDLPLYWLFQLHHQMFVLGKTTATIGWISTFGGLSFDYAEVEFDEFLWKQMWPHYESLRQCVVNNTIPEERTGLEDIRLTWQKANPGTSLEVDRTVAAKADEYLRWQKTKTEAENKLKEIAASLCETLQDKELALFNGEKLYSWKNVSTAARFDEARLKAEQPQVWAEYMGKQGSTRRLNVFKKKDEEAA